ncbi:MAG: DUF4176 domain-containing protein [Desulfitobacteriaceae bacterium]|nr:DUF4176 domain-containing protein [Desulfitobacteriaceae bacterium]MDD4401887.1 DUF4176 domain-containing protein [Desulfitobacteriaceae bacterium]
MTKDLLMQWLDNKAYLSEKDKRTLFEMGCDCSDDVSVLYNINKALVKKQEILFTDEDKKVTLKIENDRCTLIVEDEKMEIGLIKLRELITGMIDILEKIFPLGTVVDLKKQYLQKYLPVNKIENIRIVITQRFLYHDGDAVYFTYAGVVYPIGMFQKNQIINFTPALIENIVHIGYSDIQDEAYIYMMKRELILEKGMHSYGFSTEEERSRLQKRMEGEEPKNEHQS